MQGRRGSRPLSQGVDQGAVALRVALVNLVVAMGLDAVGGLGGVISLLCDVGLGWGAIFPTGGAKLLEALGELGEVQPMQGRGSFLARGAQLLEVVGHFVVLCFRRQCDMIVRYRCEVASE